VAQPGKQIVDVLNDERRSIAVLDIGGVNCDTDHQPGGIGHILALAVTDLLGRIVAACICHDVPGSRTEPLD
jgi:hypothetical protein